MVARRRLPGASRSELGGVVSVARRIGRAGAVALVAGTFGGAAMIAAEAVAAKTRRYAKPDMRLAMRTSIGDPAAPALRLVLLGPRPEVAVILVGTNDAMGLRRPAEAAAYLGGAVRRLRDAGVAVVVGTCPDLGAVRAFAPPLRQLVGLLGRQVARAQAQAVREAGGVSVDLAERAGPVFRADAGTLCHDGLHPSADGYRVWAHALYPAVAEAAGVVSH